MNLIFFIVLNELLSSHHCTQSCDIRHLGPHAEPSHLRVKGPTCTAWMRFATSKYLVLSACEVDILSTSNRTQYKPRNRYLVLRHGRQNGHIQSLSWNSEASGFITGLSSLKYPWRLIWWVPAISRGRALNIEDLARLKQIQVILAPAWFDVRRIRQFPEVK